ncbi:MAG: DUF4382 domain-containing protein [Acidobacteria bacterium]|nr:DUF4382 domain-containing protein [Acidobacteriota bacterium]
MEFGIRNFKSSVFIFIVLAALALAISGCASGGGTSTGAPPVSGVEEGDIVISLTDAAGDFSSYTVDVLSLNLTKANGAEVSVLPLRARVDFAQYTEMTEFLTAATVPSGVYVAATMTLDYQNADIWVENESGDNVQVTGIVDEDGNPVATLEMSVRLEDRNRLTIAPGIAAHLLLDFDLQASNQVDFSVPGSPILTVDPFLVADVNRTHPDKIHRIRGLLDDVNFDESSFSVNLRPFYRALTDSHRLFGIRSVITDDETVFHIDGQIFEGLEGLSELESLGYLSPVAALGALRFNPLRFEAWEVYAGTSVPGAGFDAVSGWVAARTGDTLTVKGASLIRSGTSFVFNDEVTVEVAESTLVTRQISGDIYTKDDISVGQHITAFGAFSGLEPGNLEMDATDGMVRMMMTTVRGNVVEVDGEDPVAELTLDLQSIGKFRVGNFDFTGTGTAPEFDADPANYEIDSATMDLGEVAAGTPVKIKGFVAPFGMAPPDFSAFSVTNVTDLKAFIRINWVPASDTPFTGLSPEGLTVDLDGAGPLHYLVRGSVVTDLFDLPAAPVIAPDRDGRGLYILKIGRSTEIQTFFDDFVSRIEELLDEGYAVGKLSEQGYFDDSEAVLATDLVEIHLADIP